MGISYQTVVDNNLIKDEVLEYVPRECECGKEIEFTNTLKQIYCSNDFCPYKIASRLEAMAKLMKADGWGESTCISVCKKFKMASPYQVFLLEDMLKTQGEIEIDVAAFPKKVASICDREKRRVQLWEVVKLAGIPSIETIAFKIFDGYKTMEDAFKDIEIEQVPFIAEKLGIKNSDSGVLALNVYNTLIKHKKELIFGEKQFEIYKATGENIHVAITGEVDGNMTKSDYIKHLNTRYSGIFNIIWVNSVTNKTQVLVADRDISSDKFKTALRINSKYKDNGLKNGLFKEEDVGKRVGGLSYIGEKVLITSSKDLINILDLLASR